LEYRRLNDMDAPPRGLRCLRRRRDGKPAQLVIHHFRT
jgi:hypothetical protein